MVVFMHKKPLDFVEGYSKMNTGNLRDDDLYDACLKMRDDLMQVALSFDFLNFCF